MTSADTIPTMIVCRWAKCRQFFDTDYKLARHVLDQHIGTATPVKRKEIALERRVANGTSSGDKLPTSLFLSRDVLSNQDKDGGEQVVFDTHTQAPQTLMAFPLPSPTPSRFSALDASSSPSPDPAAMLIEAPSLSEMVHNTLRESHNQPGGSEANPSPPTTKPLTTTELSRVVVKSEPPPDTSSQLLKAYESLPVIQDGSSLPHTASENHVERSSLSQLSTFPTLSRRFRLGTIHLDHNLRQPQNDPGTIETLQDSLQLENMNPFAGHVLQSPASRLAPPQAGDLDISMNDTDLFDPETHLDSILPLSEYFNSSQLQLRSQASIEYDSQYSFDSQY